MSHSLRVVVASLSLFITSGSLASTDKRIAITIDDLPLSHKVELSLAQKQQLTTDLLAKLTQHQVTGVGFVNEDKLEVKGEEQGHVALLSQWLEAGMELGNHNYGHLGLWKTPLAAYQAAVLKGERVTRKLLASRDLPLRYYRHPYTQTGKNAEEKTAFEAFLGEHGYQVAPFTIEHDDYLYACVFDHLAEKKDSAGLEKTRSAYLEHLDTAIDSFETMSDELFGRQIAQIFLIHANAINADQLGIQLQRFKDRGYRFVTLAEALRDPAYQLVDGPSKRFGPSWLTRWARSQKKKLSVYGQPDPSGWIAEQYQRLCQG